MTEDILGNPLSTQSELMEHTSDFEIVQCQKNYETDTITIQYAGKFDTVKALEYLKKNYPSFEGKDIVAFSEPSNFRGLENVGEAVFKH